jgi:hypothetical protein
MAGCESPAEKLFLIDFLREAGRCLEDVSMAWSRVDGWYITISAPFHFQQELGYVSWFRVYPQRPILMPESLIDQRGTRRSADGSLYCRVDFLAVLHVEATPAGDDEGPSKQPLVIEIDGKGNHSSGQDIRRDYTRNHKSQRIGVPMYRYLASDVNDSQYDTGAKVLSDVWAQARRKVGQI